jgi:glycosyltransferase involved in cell wall biosynthesis
MHHRTIGVMGRMLDQDDGLGIYAQRLLQELLRQDTSSRYVLFLQSEKSRGRFKSFGNVDVCVLPARRKLFWDQVLVPIAARKYQVDMIFNPKFSVPLVTRRPCVFVQQGSDWYINPQNYPWWDNLYIRLMLPIYSRKAARMLAISHATVDDLARHTRIDVSDIVVSGAGVGANFNAGRDTEALTAFRREYRLPDDFILTLARVHHGADRHLRPYPGANTPRLVRAWLAYRRRGGQLPLVIAGRGVADYLRANGFRKEDLCDVSFPGFVPNDRIHLAYQSARCFAIATLCESFGITILEALASGCPAIVPNTCASPEIAGGAARLVNPLDEEDIADALLEVTGSERLRKRMRERGLERAQSLSWQECARRTLRVFDSIVHCPSRYRLSCPETAPRT